MKSFSELAKLANQITESINEPEYITLVLAKKASDVANQYPGDSTSKHMSVILDELSDKSTLISKKQFVGLYNKFYNNNNKFALAFSDELGIKDSETLAKEAEIKTANSLKKNANIKLEPDTNEMLVMSMKAAMDGRKASPYFTDSQKNNAIDCAKEKLANLLPSIKCSFAVDAGNQNIIVVRASTDTHKGQSTIFIPVEVLHNSECIPMNFFVANDGIKDISASAVFESFKTSVGQSLKYDSKTVLAGIMSKFDKRASISTVDLALIKDKFIGDYPVYASTDSFISPEPKTQQKRASLEHHFVEQENEFSKKMMTKSAQAEMKFGKPLILEAKKSAFNQLRKLGQSVSSINLIGYDDNGIDLSISLAGKSIIETHVKCASDAIVNSKYFTHQGLKYDMNAISLRDIFSKEASSYEKALNSPMLKTNANDIIIEIVRCGKDGNHELAEQGLSVIKEKYADKYAAAISAYQNSLMPEQKIATCNKQIILKTSMHPLCGHTMLPVKDTHVDCDGKCSPNYRRNS